MRLRGIGAVLLVVLLLVGCGSDPAPQESEGSSVPSATETVDLSQAEFKPETGNKVEVDALDNTFKGKYIEVKAGTKITFRNDGRNSHNVLPVDARDFAAIETDNFEPGTEQTIELDKPGDYPYFCSLHGTTTKGMVGAIRVVP